MKPFFFAAVLALLCGTANAQCPGGVCPARRPAYNYYQPAATPTTTAPVATAPAPAPQVYYYYTAGGYYYYYLPQQTR